MISLEQAAEKVSGPWPVVLVAGQDIMSSNNWRGAGKLPHAVLAVSLGVGRVMNRIDFGQAVRVGK